MSRLGWFVDLLVCMCSRPGRNEPCEPVRFHTAQEWRELMAGATVTYGPASGKAA